MKLQEYVVSVILPVYNAGKYLPECLESLKQQSYADIQIIAIDDNSRDDSFAILKSFKREIKNLQIYKNKKRYGQAICYNRALKQASGKFIAFMNPNDVNAVNRFKRQVNFLIQNPKTVAVGTQYTTINDQHKKLERSSMPENHEEIYETLLPGAAIQPETVMINRALLPKDLLYFKSTKYPLIFTEVFLKLFQYGKVANIRHSLYFYREGVKRQGRKYRHQYLKQVISMCKLWFASKTYNDYRPSFRAMFPQFAKGV